MNTDHNMRCRTLSVRGDKSSPSGGRLLLIIAMLGIILVATGVVK